MSDLTPHLRQFRHNSDDEVVMLKYEWRLRDFPDSWFTLSKYSAPSINGREVFLRVAPAQPSGANEFVFGYDKAGIDREFALLSADTVRLDFIMANGFLVNGGTAVGYWVEKYCEDAHDFVQITPDMPTRRAAIDVAIAAKVADKSAEAS